MTWVGRRVAALIDARFHTETLPASEPKPGQIDILLVSVDSKVRNRERGTMMRTSKMADFRPLVWRANRARYRGSRRHHPRYYRDASKRAVCRGGSSAGRHSPKAPCRGTASLDR